MQLNHRRIDWFVIITSIVCAVSCSGGGCGGCTTFQPIPGGFAPAKREANAVQARVTSSAISTIEANPATIVGGLVGSATNGVIQFSVPSSCSGSPYVCCDSNNNPVQPCGPIDIDLNHHAGDPNVLVLTPVANSSEITVQLNTRVKTEMDLPFTDVVSCGVHLDSTASGDPYLTINLTIQFTKDATTGTTRIAATNVSIPNLDSGDISLDGDGTLGSDLECAGASLLLSFATGLLTSQLTSPISDAINNATCKACPSGQVSECGSTFATACTNNVCMEGNQCLQELGVDGRMLGSSVFGSFSPSTTGALDLYEVAGGPIGTGDATQTNGGGISLGLLGGMEPGGQPRDRCGPDATEPAATSIPVSTYFQGNTRPDNNQAFDVGFGIHKSQLTQFAYAGYQGGLLCLTVEHDVVSQLTTDEIGLLSRSLGKLVEKNSPMAIGLRPQSPPTITLGPNTFMSDGMGGMTLDQPLLDVKFSGLELDFFAGIDDQFIRVFTVVLDMHLPVGLQVGAMGQLVPVVGNPPDAFTNISVKNSEAVTETPAELAALFPSLLPLVLPELSGGLPAISLPSLGGLNLDVTSVTAVDDRDGDGVGDFLAIFANLKPATMMAVAPVHTTLSIARIDMPDASIMTKPTAWAGANPPTVTLDLGGDQGNLEYSIRLDDGSWSAWSTSPRETIRPRTFWIAGMHHIDARARVVGHPETIDPTPVRVAVPIGAPTARRAPLPFEGSTGATGCTCDSSAGPGAAAPFALVVLLMFLPLRRIRRRLARLGSVVWLAALACLPGCSCGDAPCGSAKCMTGEVAHSPGRWTSIAADDKRVMVATYEPQLGDLVVADATDPTNIKLTVADGIPEGVTPTYEPSTYRGGVADPGPNVGAWTSIALSNHIAKVAYQDRDALALKYAYEDSGHKWHSYVVDAGNMNEVGDFASMTIDGSGNPAIAYLSLGVDDGMGHRETDLQLARAGNNSPGESDWTISTIASAVGTCAGLCATGEACVAGSASTDPQTCITPGGNCGSGCGSGDVCNNGTCATEIVDPMLDDIPTGTGLFVSLVTLTDGRLAAAYYDRDKRALTLAVESGPGTSQFTENILDGNVVGADKGMWSAAVVAPDDTVHIAYQEVLGNQVMYTTWNNGTAGTPEVVDDGTATNDSSGERAGDRTHPVGAGAAIYLVNGAPAIAYQDTANADVYVATKGASSWTFADLTNSTTQLDGFSIGAAITPAGSPVLAWDARVPGQDPPNALVVQAPQ
ncbi:MAG TPA: hypothetical protein VMJ10_22725 [Kofleriaceae bacterium]|nr:hypothetical protein [Kofleriaceae bacterium]